MMCYNRKVEPFYSINHMHSQKTKARGFTLLELIIVIAILAVLSVAVILVINPAETLRRGRDSTRLSDLAAIKSAIGLFALDSTGADGVNTDGMDGDDVNADCSDVFVANGSGTAITDNICTVLNATVEPGATQRESASSLVDNNGWLPISLNAISAGSPLSAFPLDPLDDVPTAANLGMGDAGVANAAFVYLYRCDTVAGSIGYEINANMESTLYSDTGGQDQEGADGGNSATLFEIGTDTGLDLCGADWGA